MTFDMVCAILCQEHGLKPWDVGRLTRHQASEIYLRKLRDDKNRLIFPVEADKPVRWEDSFRRLYTLRRWPVWRIEERIAAERIRQAVEEAKKKEKIRKPKKRRG
jgi:hypothetical protein